MSRLWVTAISFRAFRISLKSYVSQMLKGFNKVGFRLDSRLPITLPILDKLLSVAPSLVGSAYQICQFQAMCSLAFFAFLRIGEMTSTGGRNGNSPLQISQISKLLNASKELIAFKITFGNFKHSYNDRRFSITVSRQPQSCPVKFLAKYKGLFDAQIRLLGRWKSNAFHKYLRMPSLWS